MPQPRGRLRALGVRGVWVQLKSPQALRGIMEAEEMSVRRLADLCGLKAHNMIQELRNGQRTSCSPELAASIAFNLNVKRETLFVTQTSRDTQRSVQRAPRRPQRTEDVA